MGKGEVFRRNHLIRLAESIKIKHCVFAFLQNQRLLFLCLSNQIYCFKNIHLTSVIYVHENRIQCCACCYLFIFTKHNNLSYFIQLSSMNVLFLSQSLLSFSSDELLTIRVMPSFFWGEILWMFSYFHSIVTK